MSKITNKIALILVVLSFTFTFAEDNSAKESDKSDKTIITTEEKSEDTSSLKKSGKVIPSKSTNWSKIKGIFL